MKRRKFIKKSILGIFGAGLITGFYSWQIEPFWLEFVHIKMPIKNLPDSLQGKTLMQISNYSANLGIKGFSSKLSCIALSTG